jgi:anti-sigma regulatory factor (Ser/Thr protein kinase)
MTAACLGREPVTMPDWPLRSQLELAAFPTAVGCARLHARHVVLEWGLPELAETTELLVSELATNAVRASHALISPVIRLGLASDHCCVLIRVWDGGDQMPVRQDASLDSECGRGLLLVESLSAGWGSYWKDSGKVVWAMVALEEVPLSRSAGRAGPGAGSGCAGRLGGAG